MLREIWNFHRFFSKIQALGDDRQSIWITGRACTGIILGISYFVWRVQQIMFKSWTRQNANGHITRKTGSTWVGKSTLPLHTVQIWNLSLYTLTDSTLVYALLVYECKMQHFHIYHKKVLCEFILNTHNNTDNITYS